MRWHLPLLSLQLACAAPTATPRLLPAPPEVGPVDAAPVDAAPMDAEVRDAAPPPMDAARAWLLRTPEGASAPVEIEVPPGALALGLTVLGPEDTSLVVESLLTPAGEPWVSPTPEGVEIGPWERTLFTFPGPRLSPNPAQPARHGPAGVATLLAPNAALAPLPAGRWRVRVGAKDARDARVDTLVRLSARTPTAPTRIVRVHLFLTGAHGWRASNARDDPALRATLAVAGERLAAAGLRLEIAALSDSPHPTLDPTGGPGSELHALWGGQGPVRGLPLYLVERLRSADGLNVLAGLAGAIPGPLGPSARSGLAVATALSPDPATLGQLIAHELGHYLGLFHTDDGAADPLSDTPLGEAGAENLMYPVVTDRALGLSAQQAAVLRAGAALEVPP